MKPKFKEIKTEEDVIAALLMNMDRELEEDNYLCKIRELEEENARLKQELKEHKRKAAEIMYQIIYDETYGEFPPIERVMQLWQSEIENEGK